LFGGVLVRDEFSAIRPQKKVIVGEIRFHPTERRGQRFPLGARRVQPIDLALDGLGFVVPRFRDVPMTFLFGHGLGLMDEITVT
jgi:hypothetical protein